MLEIIKESIRAGFKEYPDFNKSETLVLTTFNVLKSIFIDDKKHVILSAPTGSGKSVIAYMIAYCSAYIKWRIDNPDYTEEQAKLNFSINDAQDTSYLLTSSKMLQEQLESDFKRFTLTSFSMLKGTSNYECKKLTDETGTYHSYSDRWCKTMKNEMIMGLPCSDTCGYIVKRLETSNATTAVLNYSYFLNVLRSEFNPYFKTRDLTIADEAHLLPEVITKMFSFDLTSWMLNRLNTIYNQKQMNFRQSFVDIDAETQETLGKCYQFFLKEKIQIDDVIEYTKNFEQALKLVKSSGPLENEKLAVFNQMFNFSDFDDYVLNTFKPEIIEDLKNRPDDIFIKSEYVSSFFVDNKIGNLHSGSYKMFKHQLNDMDEATLCRRNFINNVDTCVYMSATIGNMKEYAQLIGLREGEWTGFRLNSDFDFSKSPIYLTNSGYLNYNNFNANIDKVIQDVMYVCENLHPDERGIIHTSTFIVADKIMQYVPPNKRWRYLFYKTSDEKEVLIEKMKSDDGKPYIIVGPSLYEGIDLRDDFGRFNCIVKTPYQTRDAYVEAKSLRFPFWYERLTLEKFEQSIGRTNRHKTDYSSTYVFDSVANKLIYKLPEHITGRVRSKRIN